MKKIKDWAKKTKNGWRCGLFPREECVPGETACRASQCLTKLRWCLREGLYKEVEKDLEEFLETKDERRNYMKIKVRATETRENYSPDSEEDFLVFEARCPFCHRRVWVGENISDLCEHVMESGEIFVFGGEIAIPS